MRLEDYWGVGPKTSELLASELGVETAVEAIESGDIRTLTEAGLSRGRATRILRRVEGGAAMDVLATRDAREVYKDLLSVIGRYAVTDHAADRIRLLTPLRDRGDVTDRLEDVIEARDTWARLDDAERETVMDAFEAYERLDGDLSAVRAALALRDAGLDTGVFESLGELDADALAEAADALAALDGDGSVAAGADETLQQLDTQLGTVEDLAADSESVVERVRSEIRTSEEFEEGVLDHVVRETGTDLERARAAMPADATDARDFVAATLRSLADDLRSAVDERAEAVAADARETIDDARPEIDTAVEAVDDIALSLSLARFAIDFDLTRPTFVDDSDVLAVENARNLFLEANDETVQPVDYAVGEHGLQYPTANAPPSGDRVTVLTGANSGGKTTLLETLAQVQLLAQMGLPVPTQAAEVGLVDAIVFHRRHASFNAGVLESTLKNVVPPLSAEGHTLMLVDEFEAITEPGSAADLLHGLVTLTVEREALGVFVTHLADDLEPLPESARIDGIFAEGLTPELELEVDYQPRFETVGRSTPEFIVSRLVADADDREERAGFDTLARAIGKEAVQRTLSDARWSR
ncbi:DNA structure-specific ATPase involved in suppression of recombination, MutS family [Halapricum desulfuricans]|uniref:DNA structure-specific ATPase involved in suppression of recombination, MutS family n=1 Tax=Halapricum desulfuricans TaxID=2841257 RepID=A0A897NH91_9EURY|nr:DNA mismatch repair protein [Halapricum desulfuricans]QSG11701.1 DNA structure-specific ATPase involved in suppression of recombination, MutS family [Halapricum desulfuricans]